MLKRYESRLSSEGRAMTVQMANRLNRNPFFPVMESAADTVARVNGRQMVNLGSNNYLGLTKDPRVIEAANAANLAWGTGVTGSRVLNGNLKMHVDFEEELADFLDREACLVCSTGYGANLALLNGLTTPKDPIIMDEEIHASLIDGAALSSLRMRRFTHNDTTALEAVCSNNEKAEFCIVEGVYSMGGDVPPIEDISQICTKHGLGLIVDEAHGLGVTGTGGRGISYDLGDDVDFVTLTFSKSLASCGGAILGKKDVINHIKQTARPFQFTASNTPASVATAHASLKILKEEPERVAHLLANQEYFVRCLRENGVRVDETGSAIITITVGSTFRALQTAKVLWNRGVFCHPVVAPAVAEDHCLLRLSVMSTHSHSQLEQAAETIGKLGKLLGTKQ